MFMDLTLHELAAQGDSRQIESLIKQRKIAFINQKDEDLGFRAPLHLASQKGHLRCCKSLLEGGADPSSRMCMGWTPVHCAAEGGHLQIIQLLAEAGASLTAIDDYGDTPKSIARRYAHEECVAYLENVENCPDSKKTILKDKFQFAVRKNMKETLTNQDEDNF